MGQIISKVSGKEWREKQLRRISDEIFDRIRGPFGTANVTFEELYIAVLLVYKTIFDVSKMSNVKEMTARMAKQSYDNLSTAMNFRDINKISFGTYIDPPSKDQIKAEMEEFDINHDGELSREEFARFITQVTKETIMTAGRHLLVTMVITPTVASLTKKRAEGVPGVGKVVQKTPHPVFASIVTVSVLLIQRALQNKS